MTTTGVHNVPIFDVNGITSIDMDQACDQYEDHLEQNFEYIDNLTWTKSRHFMKFGFSAIHDQVYGAKLSSNIYGQYIFTGALTPASVMPIFCWGFRKPPRSASRPRTTTFAEPCSASTPRTNSR